MSGKLFYVAIKKSVIFLSVYNTLEKADFKNNDWNHIAVTCEQFKIRVFVNGSEKFLQEQWNEYFEFFLTSDRGESDNAIGNDPVLFDIPLINEPFVGSVMDLYVIGMALSVNHISDLSNGERIINYIKLQFKQSKAIVEILIMHFTVAEKNGSIPS